MMTYDVAVHEKENVDFGDTVVDMVHAVTVSVVPNTLAVMRVLRTTNARSGTALFA